MTARASRTGAGARSLALRGALVLGTIAGTIGLATTRTALAQEGDLRPPPGADKAEKPDPLPGRTKLQTPREPGWPGLLKDYESRYLEYQKVTMHLVEADRKLARAEAELAPLHATVAQLESARATGKLATGDTSLANAQLAVREMVKKLGVGELRLEKDKQTADELRTRALAVEAGWRALKRIFVAIENMAGLGIHSEEQREDLIAKSFTVMRQVDRLESVPGPVLRPFAPVEGGTPTDPKELERLIGGCKASVEYAEGIEKALEERAALKRREQQHLLKLKNLSVGDKLEESVKTTLVAVEASLSEIEAGRDAAHRHADAAKAEGNRLQKILDDLMAEVLKDGAPVRGPGPVQR